MGQVSGMVLAPGAGLGLDLRQRALEIRQPVPAGIIPDRGKQVAGGKKLLDAGGAAARNRVLIIRQAPAGIEGAAEDARPVAGQHRLVAQLRGIGIDPRRAPKQRPGRDGAVAKDLAGAQVGGAEMAGTQAARGLGVAANHQRQAGILVARGLQHGPEIRLAGPAQRGVAAGLVDDQRVAAGGRCDLGQMRVVFRQVGGDEPRDSLSRAVQLRLCGGRMHQGFDQRRGIGVEMQSRGVDQQPDGPAPRHRAARPPRQDRAQEGILDPHQPGAAAGGQGLAAPGSRAVAPDADMIAGAGQADAQRPAGQLQDAAQARPGQETAVAYEKPPGIPGGMVILLHALTRRRCPPR